MDGGTLYLFTDKLHQYAEASPEDKVKDILKNFARFPQMLAGYKLNWEIIIQAEKRYNHDAHRSTLGMRVQISTISNPTMSEAISNFEIETAHTNNGLHRVLQDTDTPDQHVMEKCIIDDMQDDYKIVQNLIHMIGGTNEKMLLRYLERENISLQQLADECHFELATYKKKIYTIKKAVLISAAECIGVKYGIIQRGRHGES